MWKLCALQHWLHLSDLVKFNTFENRTVQFTWSCNCVVTHSRQSCNTNCNDQSLSVIIHVSFLLMLVGKTHDVRYSCCLTGSCTLVLHFINEQVVSTAAQDEGRRKFSIPKGRSRHPGVPFCLSFVTKQARLRVIYPTISFPPCIKRLQFTRLVRKHTLMQECLKR
jgi:hypothetical protein